MPCNDVNCAICPNTGVCTKCKSGRFLSGATCQTATAVTDCLYWATTSTCQTCNDPFYLGSDGKCYSCQTNCVKCSGRFTCTKCSAGYYLHSSQSCVKIPDNCYEFDSTKNVCTLCNHGFYLFEGFCLECKVESGTVSFCFILVKLVSRTLSNRLLHFGTTQGQSHFWALYYLFVCFYCFDRAPFGSMIFASF